MAIRGGLRLNPDGTAQVDLNSVLIRKQWVREGLIQKASTSFWDGYKGTDSSSVIHQKNLDFANGNQVVFDFDGNLHGKPVMGATTAIGTGEQKKKFSSTISTERARWVVDNGDKFDGFEIGDDAINEHSDSMSKLGDLFIRSTDQAYFDLGQQSKDFGINLGKTFTFDMFLDVETVIKNGTGFNTSPIGISKRRPLKPVMLADGRPVWIWVIDTFMKNALLKSTGAQSIFAGADVKGNDNRLIKGVIGRVGNFLFVEAPSFFGSTTGKMVDSNGYYRYGSTGVEIAGMRLKDDSGKWSGEAGFNTTKFNSVGFILGENAFQFATSKAPDYKFEESPDFGIKSESCLESWMGAKAVKLYDENSDYDEAKVAGYDYGIITTTFQSKGY